jgi:hypothetical protein
MSSSYQNLVEGKLELIFKAEKDEELKINYSELLRDLYKKVYSLESMVQRLEAQVPKPETAEDIKVD